MLGCFCSELEYSKKKYRSTFSYILIRLCCSFLNLSLPSSLLLSSCPSTFLLLSPWRWAPCRQSVHWLVLSPIFKPGSIWLYCSYIPIHPAMNLQKSNTQRHFSPPEFCDGDSSHYIASPNGEQNIDIILKFLSLTHVLSYCTEYYSHKPKGHLSCWI